MQVPQLHLGAGSRFGPTQHLPRLDLRPWQPGHQHRHPRRRRRHRTRLRRPGGPAHRHQQRPASRAAAGRRAARRRTAAPNLRPRRRPWSRRNPRHRHLLCRGRPLGSRESSHRRQGRRAPLNVWSELATARRRPRRQPAGPHLGAGRRFDAARGVSATSSLLEHMDSFKDDRPGTVSTLRTHHPLEGQRGVVIGLG